MHRPFVAFAQPVTQAFPQATRDNLAASRLSDARIRAFHRDGYLTGLFVLDASEVRQLRARLTAIVGDLPTLRDDLYEVEEAWLKRPQDSVCHFLGAWMIDSWFHDLLWHPAVTMPAAQVLGVERLRFWHDQVFSKPPNHPGVVPWHQDYSYWTRTLPLAHVTVHIALDDSTVEGGCLHYVPGSHRWPLLPKLPFDASMEALQSHLSVEQQAAFRPVPVPLQAGFASIHHGMTVHGSPPNRTAHPRRAIVLNFMAPTVRSVDGATPLLKGVPLIPAGAVVEGPHFPIVLDLAALG